MSISCYILSANIFFHRFSQVAAKITFTSETSAILLIPKCLPSNAKKNSFAKIVEHKLAEAFLDGIQGDVQLGHFPLLSVPISQHFPSLTSLYFFSFLK